MPARRTVALLAALLVLGLLVGGLPGVAGTPTAATPTLEIENQDDTTYRVTAYAVADRDRAMHTNFRVTTRDGERRLATLSQLVWPDGFRNVTLADEGIPAQPIRVGPGENVTTRVEDWKHGDVTVYVMEDLGDGATHVRTDIESCPTRGQEHGITFSNGSSSGSSTCGAGIGWLFS